MSDMQCPICGTILDKAFINDKIRGCPKCRNMGNIELWQELIRTREELYKANAELDYIKEQVEKSNAFIRARIKVAAEQIARGIIDQVKTTKEQKDVK